MVQHLCRQAVTKSQDVERASPGKDGHHTGAKLCTACNEGFQGEKCDVLNCKTDLDCPHAYPTILYCCGGACACTA